MHRRSSGSVRVSYPRYSKQEIVKKLKDAIRSIADKHGIKLAVIFGSYASDRYTASSDVDLLLVVEKLSDDTYTSLYLALTVPRLEIHAYDIQEFKEYLMKNKKFVSTLTEGIVLLDRIGFKVRAVNDWPLDE